LIPDVGGKGEKEFGKWSGNEKSLRAFECW
jgi:hypothetical protein